LVVVVVLRDQVELTRQHIQRMVVAAVLLETTPLSKALQLQAKVMRVVMELNQVDQMV